MVCDFAATLLHLDTAAPSSFAGQEIVLVDSYESVLTTCRISCSIAHNCL